MNILKDDIYEPNIIIFITILNNLPFNFFNKICLKTLSDERRRPYCYLIHSFKLKISDSKVDWVSMEKYSQFYSGREI